MTSNPADTTPVANDDAHDKLLAAIGTEAQTVAETSAGQASTALVELSRAYALVTSATTFPAAARYAFRQDDGKEPLPIPMRVTLPERTFVLQQIPAPITTPETPAATEARDALLTVIGTTARNLQKYPGQASTHLTELARAYTLVTTRSISDLGFVGFEVGETSLIASSYYRPERFDSSRFAGHMSSAAEARDRVLTAIGAEAQNLTEQPPVQASTQLKELARAFRGITITSAAINAYWKGSEKTATDAVAPQTDGDGQEPAQITTPPEAPAAAEARNQLLTAISAEAQNLTEQFPGQASAQLAELARTYASVSTRTPAITRQLGDMSAIFANMDVGVAIEFSPEQVTQMGPSLFDARDQLLAAIGAEAQNLTEQFPGQASAQLAELARAYNALDGYYVHQPEE
ncbi:hypothetical protein ACFYZT_32075 [Streptomyces sp. NPDC001591]|uniref:hypothetical protein n=1 Tax=Streptomyces sp. NPDC001591 TaxID=3364589 RepID=UPI0036A41A01